jgi:regulator of sigma E protease
MAILILIIGISVLILIHEFGHFLSARRMGLWVEEFGIGFPPRLFARKIGETLWSINALPFGGFVRIHGEKPELEAESGKTVDPRRSFANLSVGKRALIISAGVIMNFFLGWLLVSAVYAIGVPQKVVIQSVGADTPAAIAGFTSGDILLDFNVVDVFTEYVQSSKGKEIHIAIERNGEMLTLTATPRVEVPEGEGPLGVSLTEFGQKKLPLVQSLIEGLKTSAQILLAIIVSLSTLIVGLFTEGAVMENFVGPVGIFQIANESARFGLVNLLQLIGLISLNLVVLNVLPIPALDGGRLFFLLIEKIKGSPIAVRREATANAIGFVLLLLLMVFITIRDVVRIF